MLLASGKTFPSMAWISLARPSMDDATQWGSIASLVAMLPGPWPREVSIEWPIAVANKVAA